MDPQEVILLDRPLTVEEITKVSEAVERHIEDMVAKGHPLGPYVFYENIPQFIQVLADMKQLEAYALKETEEIVGVLGWTFEPIWWTDDLYCLKEQLVFSLKPVGFGRIAVKRLDEISKRLGCPIIETGSILSANQKLPENLYVRKGGYQVKYQCYVKVREDVS